MQLFHYNGNDEGGKTIELIQGIAHGIVSFVRYE